MRRIVLYLIVLGVLLYVVKAIAPLVVVGVIGLVLLAWKRPETVGRLAERVGWFPLLIAGNVAFGLVYGTYGLMPIGLMPVSMVLSGLASAFIFAPSLLLVSDLVRRGNGEGLFGIFQIAGSLGFLLGPMVGGILVAVTGGDGRPAYEAIFMMVGVAELGLALGTMALRRGFAIRQA